MLNYIGTEDEISTSTNQPGISLGCGELGQPGSSLEGSSPNGGVDGAPAPVARCHLCAGILVLVRDKEGELPYFTGDAIKEPRDASTYGQMFDNAKLTEIANLEGGNAIELVVDPDEIKRIHELYGRRILPSRFILTRKDQELGQPWKAKARWILLGHKDPGALELERFAPTPATATVYLVPQILGSMNYKLVVMDVSRAFGQSEAEERANGPLFARPGEMALIRAMD